MKRLLVLFLVLCPMVIYAKGGKKMKKKPELVYKEMADEAPEPLLYEKKGYGAYYIGKWPDGMRILQNGEVWFCYDWAMMIERGRYVERKNLPRIWRHWGEVVPPEEIEKFKEFVRQNKILELPGELPSDDGYACIGGWNVFITIEVDGKRHTIHWIQCGDKESRILKQIQEFARDIWLKALDLWVQKYKGYYQK
jgi:hypothetical protein